jgi:hypothetical protein
LYVSRRVIFPLVCWLAGWTFYLLFAGKRTVAELAVGAACGAFTAAFCLALSLTSRRHFQCPAGWLGRLRSIPGQVVVDCFVVLRAICRRPALARGTGRFQTRAFHPGNTHPAARMRRALVTTAISLAPNTYVVGWGGSDSGLLVHQLVPEPPRSEDPQWPL